MTPHRSPVADTPRDRRGEVQFLVREGRDGDPRLDLVSVTVPVRCDGGREDKVELEWERGERTDARTDMEIRRVELEDGPALRFRFDAVDGEAKLGVRGDLKLGAVDGDRYVDGDGRLSFTEGETCRSIGGSDTPMDWDVRRSRPFG